MADVTIDAAGNNTSARGVRSVAFTSTTTGYVFYIDADADLYYRKSTDGGATWGSAVTVFTGTANAFDIWYDRWTQGDTTGTKIYIWYVESTNDDVRFRTLDTSGDSLGTEVVIFNGASASPQRAVFVSGAKMRGGNLLCCFNIDDGTETGTYRSTDGGGTWGSRTNLIEAIRDQAWVFPGNEADNQDGWFLYHDADADELTLKVHDDSANTNSESSAIATHIELTTDLSGAYGFKGAIRHSDGHLIVAVWTGYDLNTEDFKVYDVGGAGSITALTDIVANVDDCYYPTVYVPANNHIYVAYIGKTDGSETLGTSVGVYYRVSTDGGSSWSAEAPYSAANGDYRSTYSPPNGPLFIVVWRSHTSGAQFTNSDNAVIPAALPTVFGRSFFVG